MHFNFEALKFSLGVMGKGMAGIFIVTAVIILAITLLKKLTNRDN